MITFIAIITILYLISYLIHYLPIDLIAFEIPLNFKTFKNPQHLYLSLVSPKSDHYLVIIY